MGYGYGLWAILWAIGYRQLRMADGSLASAVCGICDLVYLKWHPTPSNGMGDASKVAMDAIRSMCTPNGIPRGAG
jgi:hypothetical protein